MIATYSPPLRANWVRGPSVTAVDVIALRCSKEHSDAWFLAVVQEAGPGWPGNPAVWVAINEVAFPA